MDQNGARGHDSYSASEAAAVLGLGKRRVLQMLERGELEGTKDSGGRWIVFSAHVHALLRERQQHHERRKRSKDADPPPEPEPTSELVDSLRDEIAFLRGELQRRDGRHAEEIRRRDHLFARALERIPELQAPRDAPGSPETPADEPPKGTPPPQRPTPQKPVQRRSFWQRIVGA